MGERSDSSETFSVDSVSIVRVNRNTFSTFVSRGGKKLTVVRLVWRGGLLYGMASKVIGENWRLAKVRTLLIPL